MDFYSFKTFVVFALVFLNVFFLLFLMVVVWSVLTIGKTTDLIENNRNTNKERKNIDDNDKINSR